MSKMLGLALSTWIDIAERAVMPGFVVGMDCTEPSTANRAVIGGSHITRFIHGRLRLTGRLDFSGFCMILLLQHGPSMQVDSTRVSRAWHLKKTNAPQAPVMFRVTALTVCR
jgi:hypothetical protein